MSIGAVKENHFNQWVLTRSVITGRELLDFVQIYDPPFKGSKSKNAKLIIGAVAPEKTRAQKVMSVDSGSMSVPKAKGKAQPKKKGKGKVKATGKAKAQSSKGKAEQSSGKKKKVSAPPGRKKGGGRGGGGGTPGRAFAHRAEQTMSL
jgi:hypothetical protein